MHQSTDAYWLHCALTDMNGNECAIGSKDRSVSYVVASVQQGGDEVVSEQRVAAAGHREHHEHRAARAAPRQQRQQRQHAQRRLHAPPHVGYCTCTPHCMIRCLAFI